MDKNLRIIDYFFNLNYRSPTKAEFIKLGGNINQINFEYDKKKHRYGYIRFLTTNGYDKPKMSKSLIVRVIDRSNKMVFEGSVYQVAEEFGVTRNAVINATKKNIKFRYKYTIKIRSAVYDI